MKYRPEIDGLRAVAVIPVILFHAGVEACGGGFVGVDIFFVISGYLITGIIFEEIRTGHFSLARFYERRARRILPALLAVCLACVPLAWRWMSPLQFKDFSQSLSAVTVFASNLLFLRENGYFAAASELKPLLHTWTLAVEEQFYVFFPLLLLALRKLPVKGVMAALGGVCAASLVIALYWTEARPAAAFYLIPARAWELGVGALLALAPASERVNATLASLATLAGMALIALAMLTFYKTIPFPGYFVLMPVLGTALLIRFSGSGDPVGRLLRLPVLVNTGLVSYSLYLWHQPVFAFLRLRELHEPTPLALAGAIAFTAALAVVSWAFIETPFRRRERISAKAIATTGALTSMLVMSVGLAGHVTDGFRNASVARTRAAALEERLALNDGLSVKCNGAFQLSEECRTSDEPELAVWGDSYAMHLVDGLIASSTAPKLIQFTMSVCGPVRDLAPIDMTYRPGWADGCLEFNRRVIDWITTHRSVKYVVLSSPFDQYTTDRWKFYTREGVRTADWHFAAEKFDATLTLLESHGVTPVLIAPPPSYGGDLGRCLLKLQVRNLPANSCDFAESEYRRAKDYRIKFVQALEQRHKVIWLDECMCRQGTCAAAWGNTLLYQDTGHLSHEGSAAVGRRMHLYDRVTGRSAD